MPAVTSANFSAAGYEDASHADLAPVHNLLVPHHPRVDPGETQKVDQIAPPQIERYRASF